MYTYTSISLMVTITVKPAIVDTLKKGTSIIRTVSCGLITDISINRTV